MTYHVTVVDRATREAQIKQSVVASEKSEDFYDFRGTKTALPVIRVPLNLPIYRMENFRTFSDQAEYIVREHRSSDFFKSGQENESSQQVQHDILARLAAKGKASSVVPVIEVLRVQGQQERLLITHRGVVVNGNRRLAGIRELFESDPRQYDHFQHVDCMVLPADTTAADILEIEARLQARPETKLDYDWIGNAQLFAAMLKLKGTPEAVAQVLGRKTSEVKNMLQALAEADLYLKEWAKAENEYSRVAERGEQFFKDLPGQLQNKPVLLQEASRVIAWTLFENGDKLEGRLYSYNVAFGKRAEDVLAELSEELGVSLGGGTPDDDEEYDFDMGEEPGGISYQPVIDLLRNDSRREEAIEALVEIAGSVVESEKDKKSGSAALKAISSANARLAEVDLTRASPDTYGAMERQLGSILERAQDIQARLAQLTAPPASGQS